MKLFSGNLDIPKLELEPAAGEAKGRGQLESREVREMKRFVNVAPGAPIPSIRSNHFTREGIMIQKAASKRTFKILTYKSGLGKDKLRTEYYDIITGKLIHAEPSAGGARMICHDVIGYEAKSGALSEQRGKSYLPRVLALFDGWGFTTRRRVGPASYSFETGYIVKICEQLDKTATLQAPGHFDEHKRSRITTTSEELRRQAFAKISGSGQHKKDAWGKVNDFSDGTVEAAVLNRSEALLKAQKEGKIKALPGVEMADDPKYEPPKIKLPARKNNYLAGFAVSSDKLKRMPQEPSKLLFNNSPTRPPPHLMGMSQLIKQCMK